jgi:hypothetical protein
MVGGNGKTSDALARGTEQLELLLETRETDQRSGRRRHRRPIAAAHRRAKLKLPPRKIDCLDPASHIPLRGGFSRRTLSADELSP